MSAPHDFQPLEVFDCELTGIRQIEASAGTGKTWNICGLYLRLLLEGRLEVQRILVVTFTNAATAELRDRIRQRIVDTLAWLHAEQAGETLATGDDFVERLLHTARDRHGLQTDDMLARLKLALATFDEASIFTIHGFCQRALADTPFTAQMPLAMELVRDDADWVAEAANDFWRRRIAADDLDAGLAGHLVASKDSPEGFAALLKRHLSKPMATARWPDDLDASAGVPADDLRATHALAFEMWHGRRDSIEDAVLRGLPGLHKGRYKEEWVHAAAAAWDTLLAQDDGLVALDIEEASLDKLPLLGTAKLKSATNKGQVTPSDEFFDVAQRLLDLRAQATQALAYGRLALLKAMLAEGAQAQREAKRRQRVIAFDDMLFNLHDRLTRGDSPWLAGELKKRFPAALIDEFQDTDPLQFAIFKTIYTATTDDALSDAPLFFVGDPKQAIYSFRNADLHTYIEAGTHAVARYSLADNQRSSEPLIRALNTLFEANPRAFMMDALAYTPVNFGKKPRQPLVDTSAERAPLHVWTLPPADDGEPMFQRDATTAVVAATADEIARLLAAAQRGEVRLGKVPNERPLAAGDIAVLVRSNAQGTQIREALTARGVGSVELSQASVFRSSDAEELDRVLAAVLEPARERTLKAALSTELMGYDAAAIAALAGDESALLAAVQRFAGWRDVWLQRGVGFMLRQWLAADQVAGRLLARPDGERRLTNLLHLVECLHEAGERHAAPDTLLRWFQSQRVSPDADDATQLRLESDQNLVQIVTIHKSKGLEYPVVFCPFLWSASRGGRADGLTGLAYHDDGQTVIDYGHDFRDETHQKAVKQKLKLEESAETLRLVYVALTRAVHRCVIVAGCYRMAGRYPSATASTRSLLNWLVAGAGQSPEEWFEHKDGAAPIESAWAALAERSDGAIAVTPLPIGNAATLQLPRPAADTLAALPPPRTLPGGWWIGSFSAIAHGAAHDRSGVDHDLRVLDMPAATADKPPAFRPADDDPLNFPRGPAAGEAIHHAFEKIDFTDRDSWREPVTDALKLLRTMGVPDAPGDDGAALRSRMLERLLEGTLDTPLPLDTPNPLRLSELPTTRRLVELEFHLPAHRFDAATLNDTLAAQGYAMPRLSFATLRGFLKGFIDLVFEHDGRFFILDWKSNHLGDTPAHYGQASMAAAMRDQGYHLQYLLYLVALDRYLRHRLAGYDPARHLGGAVYLFVRGVRPDWRDDRGAPTGVFFTRPSPALIARLSSLFDETETPS